MSIPLIRYLSSVVCTPSQPCSADPILCKHVQKWQRRATIRGVLSLATLECNTKL